MKKNLCSCLRGITVRNTVILLTGILWLGTSSLLYAQKNYVYSGNVTDKLGETVPGVSIVIKGTADGTLTDMDGNFTLKSEKPTEILVFSFIGKTKQEILATAGIPLKVVLEDENVDLEGVVVIGYGAQKKSVVTGSISSVKAKDLEKVQINRIEQALQGRTSGISIISSSGQPGSGSTIMIRGMTSVNAGSNGPLFIVDGVPIEGGIDYLSPSDIESIEVLKDAASAAIYGTRAANGVIMVSTKKGKSGSLTLNYHTYFGTQSPANKLKMLNATEYATLQNEASKNSGLAQPFADPESFGAGTDWQSTIYNSNAGIQSHDINVSGGNDKSTFYTSFGYFKQEGIVASEISNFNKFTVRLNSTHKVTKWLNIGQNFGFSSMKSMGSLNTNSEYGGPLASAVNLDPITQSVITDPVIANSSPYNDKPVMRDAAGNPYGISTYVMQEMSNPLAYIKAHEGNHSWSQNFVGNVFVEIEPIAGLKLKSDLGAKLAYWGGVNFTPIAYFNPSSANTKNSFGKDNNHGSTWTFENTATYSKKIGDHDFSLMAGTSAFVDVSEGMGFSYQDLPVNTYEEASMNFDKVHDQYSAYAWEGTPHKISSVFSRLTYNYKEKYLFTGIVRRDGSTKFGANYKYGYFPSASIGWVVSREGFWKKNDFVNFLKLRGSYGVNGNDRIGDFLYLSTIGGGRNYTFGSDMYTLGFSPNAPSNPDLRWEETTQANVGLEATVFKDYTFVLELFRKSTSGMLWESVIPSYIGAEGNPMANIADMFNKGVEIELGYHKLFGEVDFKINANASYIYNEITYLGTVEYRDEGSFQSSDYNLFRNMVGHSYMSFYGYQILDIFQNAAEVNAYSFEDANGLSQKIQPNAKPGDFRYADLSGPEGVPDGKITADDRTFIGNALPDWTFGGTISASFKNFDMSLFGQGAAGNEIYFGLRRLDIPTANWTTDALDRWNGEGSSNEFPRLAMVDGNKNFSSPSSFHLSSGTYFRIKNLQIGYTLPTAVAKKIGLQNLRIYLSSNNLATFTKYKGFDPEIGGGSLGVDRGVYPQARSFLAGLNITL